MTETSSTFSAMLKELYTTKKIETLSFDKNVLFAQMPKKTDVEGETWDTPVIYGDGAAASADFATAQANKSSIPTIKFQITTRDEYAVAAFTRKVMKQSASNKGAFLKGAELQIDSAFRRLRKSLGINIFGDGTGLLGTVASLATATITLAEPKDAVKFTRGMKIDCYDVSGDALEAQTIVAIDRKAGTLTLDAAPGAFTLVAGDGLYREGDKDIVFKGLGSWIPSVAPTSGDDHYGVDRSADADMLAGIRLAVGNGAPVREVLLDLQSDIFTNGDGIPDHCYIHPLRYADLIKEYDGKLAPNKYDMTDKIGFSGVCVQGHHGEMRVFADRYCPYNSAYALDLKSWEFGSMGKCPDLIDEDGNVFLREPSSDGFEVRAGGYVALSCNAPGHNGVATWS